MKVRKENRVLTVDEADKAFYLSEGYDVVELNKDTKQYDVVEPATGGKTYSVAEYNALKNENETLKAKIVELETDADWNEQIKEPTREEMKEALTKNGVEFPGNISNEKLTNLYVEHFKGDGE